MNINFIGLFIFLLLVIAFVKEGPAACDVEAKLERSFGRMLAGLTAIGLGLTQGEALSFAPLHWINVFVNGLGTWVHEAGHGALFWSPRIVHVVGGTLFQIGVPLALASYCIARRCPILSACWVFVAGHQLVHCSPYIADARAMKLPLLGGGHHDWNFILGYFGALELDATIATIVTHVGTATMTLSIIALFFPVKLNSLPDQVGRSWPSNPTR